MISKHHLPHLRILHLTSVELYESPSLSLRLSPSLSLFQMDGPFQDVELLKSRPAHMTVFMRYVFSQLLDPNPLVSTLTLRTAIDCCSTSYMGTNLVCVSSPYNSCSTCRWRPTWAPALKTPVPSRLRSAPTSWTLTLCVSHWFIQLINSVN